MFLQQNLGRRVGILVASEGVVIIGKMVLHQKSVAQLSLYDAIYSRNVNDLGTAGIVSVSRRRFEKTLEGFHAVGGDEQTAVVGGYRQSPGLDLAVLRGENARNR